MGSEWKSRCKMYVSPIKEDERKDLLHSTNKQCKESGFSFMCIRLTDHLKRIFVMNEWIFDDLHYRLTFCTFTAFFVPGSVPGTDLYVCVYLDGKKSDICSELCDFNPL